MPTVGQVVVEVIAEADTRAFDKFLKHLEKVADKHWMTIKAVKDLGKATRGLHGKFGKLGKVAGKVGKVMGKVAGAAKKAAVAIATSEKVSARAIRGFGLLAFVVGKKAAGAYKRLAFAVGGAIKSLAKFGIKSAAIGMTALAGATVYGAKKFADLDNEMRTLGVVANIAQDEIDKMMQTVMKGSAGSIFSAQQTAEAMATIGAMGNYSADEITNLTGWAQKLAVASGFDDIARSSQTLVGALRTFGPAAGDAATVSNILMQAANISALSMDDLGTAMQFVGGRAAKMGFSINETLAALATLRNMNIDAGIASRSLSQALGHIINPSEEGAKWMRRLGIEATNADGSFKSMEEMVQMSASAYEQLLELFGGDEQRALQAMTEIYGEMGSRAMIPLINSLGDLENGFLGMNEQMNEIDPELLQRNFERMAGSAKAQLKGLRHTVEMLGMTLGQAFLGPLVKEGADGQSVIKSLTTVLTNPKIIGALEKIGGALGKVVVALLPMLEDILVTLMPHLATFIEFFADILGSKEVQTFIHGLVQILARFLDTLMPIIVELKPAILSLFQAMQPFLPLLDFFAQGLAMAFKMAGPLIQIIVALMNILAPFLPLLLQIGKFIMKFLAVPMQIANSVIAGLIDLIAHLIDIASILNPSLKDAARNIREAASAVRTYGGTMDEVIATMDEYDMATFEMGTYEVPDIAVGGEGGGGAMAGGDTIIIETTVEGDVLDKETVDTIADQIVEGVSRKGTATIK